MIDAKAELAQIKQRRKLNRQQRYIKSALEECRAELVALSREGASLADLQLWLRLRHRRRAAISTLSRYLATLPELGGDND